MRPSPKVEAGTTDSKPPKVVEDTTESPVLDNHTSRRWNRVRMSCFAFLQQNDSSDPGSITSHSFFAKAFFGIISQHRICTSQKLDRQQIFFSSFFFNTNRSNSAAFPGVLDSGGWVRHNQCSESRTAIISESSIFRTPGFRCFGHQHGRDGIDKRTDFLWASRGVSWIYSRHTGQAPLVWINSTAQGASKFPQISMKP